MKIECIKKSFIFKGKVIPSPELSITIGKEYEVLRKELKGPQGPDYESGNNPYYLYEIIDDREKVSAFHEIFFDRRYISELRDSKIDKILCG